MRNNRFGGDSDIGEEEADWKDSYSDLMTDLLAIFVVLFSFAMMSQAYASGAAKKSDINVVDGSAIEVSVNGSDGLLDGGHSNVFDDVEVQPNNEDIEANQEGFLDSINEYIKENGYEDQISVSKQGDSTILLRVASSILFESGQADLFTKADQLIEKISDVLSAYEEHITMVRIEGHTDDRPISSAKFKSNWELSTSRAATVVQRILVNSGISADKISATGFAEFQPIADNKTAEGRTLNRRVDFIVEIGGD